MRKFSGVARTFILMAILALVVGPLGLAASVPEYTFEVHNNTDQKITKILVSTDGKQWGAFDIGSGIAAGATVELVWDKATDDSDCEWFFKAVWAGADESEPQEFDFCEKDLMVEFSK